MEIKFTKSEINHILSLLYFDKHDGGYTGNKEHHYKRTDILIKKFEKLKQNQQKVKND